MRVEHSPELVRARTAAGTKSSGVHRHRIERRLIDATQGRGFLESVVAVSTPSVISTVAAVEVDIHSCVNEVIPPIHGRLQAIRIDADLLGQCIQRRRAVDPFGYRLARGRGERAVLARMGFVEHQPGGQVGVPERHGIHLVERTTERVVVAGFVGEPAPRSIDHDRTRQGALTIDEVGALMSLHLISRDLDGRHPPRLTHVAQTRACTHRHQQSVAGIRGE